MDRLVTVVNGVSHFKTYQTQQRSLVSKMAERMLLQGFVDSSIIQINAAFKILQHIYAEITHEMSKETDDGMEHYGGKHFREALA